ncbi:MOSC N-terminal beta barrel domain-containing protein [Apiospora marii]|uniref:Molybdenum cofactor sulfurase n=1 Tax=Apiospora marii TaxID=335849 RepID=A0ABR1SEX5_9PEZI
MADYDGLAYDGRIEALREMEYPMLKDSDTYLDHAGTTLYAKSLVDEFAADMTANLFGNPHSASGSSQLSMARIDDVRVQVLQLLNADPTEFDVVFVANATAGIKLVADALRSAPAGFSFMYHQACHTSLVGVRQESRASICIDTETVQNWVDGAPLPDEITSAGTPLLFGYPAQSNMDGTRLPLDWSHKLRRRKDIPLGLFTLLDAAAYVATSPLNLGDSESAPDFTVMSFNKIFGFPDLGALVIRKDAMPVFQHRKYFGGGTVDMVVCVGEQWHAPKSQSLHEALEDGTLPIHSIVALGIALAVHRRLFGTMTDISLHTSYLAQRLQDKLDHMRHSNGRRVCKLYSPAVKHLDGSVVAGPVVTFNLQDEVGAWISLTEFEKTAVLKGFHIRTGGLCNPGGVAAALDLMPWEMKRNFSSGFRCGDDNDILEGKPTGTIRVSFGAMSTISDVDRFVAFVHEFYRSSDGSTFNQLRDETRSTSVPDLVVASITVFPIKSCGGFHIPEGRPWEVKTEGLAWDREWCLLHLGTSQALSQKRYPHMALLRPCIDFDNGVLEVSYIGEIPKHLPSKITVPLSPDPAYFDSCDTTKWRTSRVCGEEIVAHTYTSATINNFFSEILGVPCLLARFPSGGQGQSMRHVKAQLQQHQAGYHKTKRRVPGAFPTEINTPPDSDSEVDQRRMLLSNESPLLAINTASLRVLNMEIRKRGGKSVSADVFRANIVLDSPGQEDDLLAYTEDHWSALTIGNYRFQMLGSCRRCHMVCIHQDTAAKSEEPFATLSKTRRFNGKVFFGTHMCYAAPGNLEEAGALKASAPMIRVGDRVSADC